MSKVIILSSILIFLILLSSLIFAPSQNSQSINIQSSKNSTKTTETSGKVKAYKEDASFTEAAFR